jgi:NADH-quinone oxidoreductase subunit E
MEKAEIEKILDRYDRQPGQIIAILHEIQESDRYLPEDALRYVAEQLKISVSQIFHIATFYKAYSLKPKGKHLCNVCLGTACHVRGAPLVLEQLERKLGIKNGDTTEDMEYSLSTVNCLGACALGPLVTVDGDYFGNMNTAKVEKMLEQVKSKGNGGAPPAEESKEALAQAEPVRAESLKPVVAEKKAAPAPERARAEKPAAPKPAKGAVKKVLKPKTPAGKRGGKKK